MSNKKYYMTVDTETCGNIVFDFGFTVTDRKGNMVAEGSFVAAEFINHPEVLGMFTDRFTKKKIAGYYFDLYSDNGAFQVLPFDEIRNIFNAVVAQYRPAFCAYNSGFDIPHLDLTAQYFGYDAFFTSEVEEIDLWAVAMSLFCKTRKYVTFCVENDFFTDKGNIPTGAEIVYRYLTDCPDFEEAHTARRDCEIEREILRRAFARKKPMKTGRVGVCVHNPDWKEIQAIYAAL